MKPTLLLIAAIASLGSSAFAKLVDIEDVPEDVRATIEANFPENRIDDVEINFQSKLDRYVATLDLRGERQLRVYVSSEGDLIKEKRDVLFRNLPKPVRDAVEDELDENDEVTDVERVTKGERVRYVITIRDGDDDETSKIIVSPNGTVLEGELDVELRELSRKIRQAINDLRGELWEIRDIDRIVEDGEVSYRVVLELSNGVTVEVSFDSEGNLIDEEEPSTPSA